MYNKDIKNLYDLCIDMLDVFENEATFENFKKDVERMEAERDFSPLFNLVDDETTEKTMKRILSLYQRRYKVEIFIKAGVYGFAHVLTDSRDIYYYNSLKQAQKESLEILHTFKHVKGNCASIYDNNKMILTTNNDIDYWFDYRKEM